MALQLRIQRTLVHHHIHDTMLYTSSSSTSSTANLLTTSAPEKTVPAPQGKDYAAAFGSLQTQFGLDGSTSATASGTTPRPANGTKRAWWKPQRRLGARAGHPEAQASAPVPASTQPASGRDFEAAFGQLQSSQGLNGGVLVQKDKPPPKYVQLNT